MPVFTLAAKDLRLLLRDPRSAVILLLMPLVLTLVMGLALGEGFGEKADDRLRVSVVLLDGGLPAKAGRTFPAKPWSELVLDDLAADPDGTGGGIRVEVIGTREEAEKLVARGKRPAVLVFEREFSDRMDRASFLAAPGFEPVNPLGRDGVVQERVGLTVLRDPTQPTASAVIEQVAQVSMFRVVIPYMIGQAFARVGDDRFMEHLAEGLKERKPLPPDVLVQLDPTVQKLLAALLADPKFDAMLRREFGLFTNTIKGQMPQFRRLVSEAFRDREVAARVGKDVSIGEVMTPAVRAEVGPGVKAGVGELFPSYDFTALTWQQLTRTGERGGAAANRAVYADPGAKRYQILVPQFTVMFAFFLVLTVGWLFVAERTHGTLVRLRAAPLSRGQVLLGKLLPCLLVSLVQGVVLLLAGRVVFGMSWGAEPWLLLPVVASTSAAAVGLAMLVASAAKTETQVAVYGTLLVLVLGGASGSLMPRELMPEAMKRASQVTPHAWALDAYSQLLGSPTPDVGVVVMSCVVLLAFGAAFLALAWWRLDLT
ncbi:ABC transporter permease [Urbifossiella limnaea]|uniref:Inner membrane transport permease YbhR n=1 Tax=Urbifossiella limnaea TaxID=2528023 RepID=A0A517Y0T5_9BACT|nr:ABC transporter permease [Urbifossiella limnaea]QDU23363.1 Inner membrane transport permease YbhR [Urbifossiella limnaea]